MYDEKNETKKKSVLQRVWAFVVVWNEFLTVPAAILLFFVAPMFIRLADPTAGAYDAGVLHRFVLPIIGLLLFNGVAWLLLKWNFPDVYNYFQNGIFEKNLMNFAERNNQPKPMTLWERSKLSMFLFALYFLALVLLYMGR